RFVYRWPVLNNVFMQINFWLIANTVLLLVNVLTLHAASLSYGQIHTPPFFPLWGLASLMAIFYGTFLGLIDAWMDKRFGQQVSVGMRILIKGLLYTVAFVFITVCVLFLFENVVLSTWLAEMGMHMSPQMRLAWGLTFVPTTLAGNFVVSFIKQANRSFGPGLLVSLLLGRYQRPVTERRIFMFMDLKDSTTHAEALGPYRYSAMVRDLFHDVDSVVPRFEAEIYQYVGDEVVFTWNENELTDKRKCLLFFFAVRSAIEARAEHYKETYGFVPAFKAGLHVGDVVAVEIGDIKREVAYHGDTINTAARIQAMCNEFGRSLMASEELVKLCDLNERSLIQAEPLGSVLLKGKRAYVTIHAIEPLHFAERHARAQALEALLAPTEPRTAWTNS
ncbi:MAG TPA: adenylate/guanylate cyclase domain-containing protein, partial [Flavobacteriales bacterium]|nr:adenylate/guanylate cyclase domain-containing protein [Flavobacteriales bacterium]